MPQDREGLLPGGGQAAVPLNAESPPEALRQLVTPTSLRFVRSHTAAPETLSESFELNGAVAQPMSISLAQLRELASATHTITTECAGNHRTQIRPEVPGEPWKGGAISTSQWTGVPLERLLAWAGLKEAAVEIAFHSADGSYARSLPVSKALDPGTLVAYELNGEPIPARFGGPIRLVVPGWYGMASVKWLARIEALERPFEGEFQTHKYMYGPGKPVTTMRPKSIFLDPRVGASFKRGRIRVRGLAWGGEGGVVQVDVKLGDDWHPARLLGPALPHAWRRWEIDWDVRKAGDYVLLCRAKDVAGNVQPEVAEWNPLGYGANAIQRLAVRIG